MKKVELLAPAGSMEAFHGALNAGADAVYLAGQQFGARAYAQNFTEEELKDVLKTAHLFHVKIYLTVNVLTREEELPELVRFVSRLYEAGLDGVIVQDLGVADVLRQACPELLLHASTQMSITGRRGARFLLDHGFSRVVPARELSLPEIRLLKETGIEVEAFIHGAMCYCYSGRCLMSSFLGGRSGNRGRCAGPCRLPYEVMTGRKSFSEKAEEFYPLSMRDMCVLPILPDLMDAGIDSFKIEGRMKKPEYAAGTTAIYRKYIDRFYEWDAQGRPGKWKIEEEDLKVLHQLYIRADLSTGYYHERNGRDMLTIEKPGYAGADPDRLQEIREKYVAASHNLPIAGRAVIRAGQRAELSLSVNPGNNHVIPFTDENDPTSSNQAGNTGNLSCEGKDGTVRTFPERITVFTEGETVQPAQSRPLSEQNIREKLMKTGDSPFAFLRPEDLKVETDGRSFLPVSQLNDLRRRALDSLAAEMLKPYEGRKAKPFGPDDAGHAAGTDKSVIQAQDPKVNPEDSGMKSRNAGSTRVKKANPGVSEFKRQQKLVIVQTMEQAMAALESEPDILILDGPLRDHPDEILNYTGHDTGLLPAEPEPAANSQSGSPDKTALLSDDKGADRKESRHPSLLMAALPHVLRASDEAWLRDYVGRFGNIFYGFITRNVEELEFLKQIGYSKRVIADSGLYAWNTQGLVVLSDYCSYNVLPLELDRHELWDTFGKNGILQQRMILAVYGKAPLMITANCVRKTMGRCLLQAGDKSGRTASPSWCGLKDRTGTVFPVQTDCRHCGNIIYNSVPTSLHKFAEDPVRRQAAGILYSFTDESAEEVTDILQGKAPDTYTAGHFRKGAL